MVSLWDAKTIGDVRIKIFLVPNKFDDVTDSIKGAQNTPKIQEYVMNYTEILLKS